jgi:hypothetical protein
MPEQYLHERKDFIDLLRILEQETKIQIQLIEKDYWIMHVLYGLKKQGFEFELKGGTSLSNCLLEFPEVIGFIGTKAYFEHKKARFPKKDLEFPVSKNEALLLNDPGQREEFEKRYKATAALYYKGQPEFKELLDKITSNINSF